MSIKSYIIPVVAVAAIGFMVQVQLRHVDQQPKPVVVHVQAAPTIQPIPQLPVIIEQPVTAPHVVTRHKKPVVVPVPVSRPMPKTAVQPKAQPKPEVQPYHRSLCLPWGRVDQETGQIIGSCP